MKNILVVNVNWLGDVVFSTPVFKALKKAYPHARVSCLAVPRVKEVLEHCPYIDEVIIYDERGRHWYPWEKLGLIFYLRRKKFDTAFLLHRSATRAFLMFLVGIPERVGHDSKKQSWFLTRKICGDDEGLHRSDEYLKIIEGYGIAVDDRTCELAVSDEEYQAVETKLAQFGVHADDPLVVVNAGGNWDLKRWPALQFSQLIARLVNDFQMKVLIPGADKDVLLAEQIARQSGVNPLVWAGATSMGELIALFKRANVVISNDSGPLHLAASVGTDGIGLFGPTRPEMTGPRGRGSVEILHQDVGCNKAPCYYLECPHNECMHAITVNDVLQVFQNIRN